jgi:hypothetical protein
MDDEDPFAGRTRQRLFVRSFVRSFVCSFVRSFVRWFSPLITVAHRYDGSVCGLRRQRRFKRFYCNATGSYERNTEQIVVRLFLIRDVSKATRPAPAAVTGGPARRAALPPSARAAGLFAFALFFFFFCSCLNVDFVVR